MADIVKYQLATYIKNAVALLKPVDINLSQSTAEYRGEGPNWVHVAIKGPHDMVPRIFEIRVTEKLG